MSPFVLVCWAIGLGALWRCAVAVRRSAFELLSPVTIVVAGFFWIYVIGYFVLDPLIAASYLSEEGYLKVLFLAILSGGAFAFAVSKSKPGVTQSAPMDQRFISAIGIGLVAVGAVGWAYFLRLSGGFAEYYGAAHGAAGAWFDTTAYVYGTINFMFSGSVLLVAAHAGRRLGLVGRLILWWTVAFLSFDAWATGSRGHMLRLGLLAAVYLVFWRSSSSPSRRAVLGLLAIQPLLLVVVPFLRAATYLGAEQSLAEVMRSAFETTSGLGESGPGSEVIYAGGLVQAAWEQGVYDFGYLWLHPIVNVVPRLLWPDKPYAAEFSVDNHQLLWRSFGWVPTEGAAPTGLADSFVRFSWGSPAIWAFAGWIGGQLFHAARLRKDVTSVSYFFCYLVGLSYMLTQDLNAAIYSALFLAIPLAVAFSIAKRARRVVRA